MSVDRAGSRGNIEEPSSARKSSSNRLSNVYTCMFTICFGVIVWYALHTTLVCDSCTLPKVLHQPSVVCTVFHLPQVGLYSCLAQNYSCSGRLSEPLAIQRRQRGLLVFETLICLLLHRLAPTLKMCSAIVLTCNTANLGNREMDCQRLHWTSCFAQLKLAPPLCQLCQSYHMTYSNASSTCFDSFC